MSRKGSSNPKDKYGLLKLIPGRTRYLVVEEASKLDLVQHAITANSSYYLSKQLLPSRVFTTKVFSHDEVGILYGLNMGHENEQ